MMRLQKATGDVIAGLVEGANVAVADELDEGLVIEYGEDKLGIVLAERSQCESFGKDRLSR
jgi:hypothetical protein